jgi:subtilase family serine protease
MFDALLTALALPLLAATMPGACTNPAIISAAATPVGSNGKLTTFNVAIRVKNTGTVGEPPSLLQSVEVFQDATKVDQKSAPPLAPGQAATVHYVFQRSAEAQPGSTHLRFRIVTSDPHGTTIGNCSVANSTFRINV